MGILEKGLEALYPSNIYCISCGSVIDKTRDYALCDSCMEKFHWLGQNTCEKCGKLLPADYSHPLCYDCRQHGHEFDKGYTCVQYSLYERGVLLDYKYKGRSYIGRKLGDIFYDRMALTDEVFDLVVPVPLHRKKQIRRGYNQAEVMARQLADRWGIPCGAKVLERVRDTRPMRGLGVFERYENLQGAFVVSRQNQDHLRGKKLLLVDDIYTTGSTMDACSEPLRQAGAERICCLTFACGANVPPGEFAQPLPVARVCG